MAIRKQLSLFSMDKPDKREPFNLRFNWGLNQLNLTEVGQVTKLNLYRNRTNVYHLALNQ